MKQKDVLALIGFIVVSELAGIVGSIFTTPQISGWYATLQKPPLAPPNWVFGPVWTALFALMGIAAFLVWSSYAKASARQEKQHSRILQNVRMLKAWKIGMMCFVIQLGLNTLWSIIFFGLQNPQAAFFELIILWLAIFVTIIFFYKISRVAAILLLPYILWVSFAGYLNYMLWTLNAG